MRELEYECDFYTSESTLKVGESSFDYEPPIRKTDKGVYIGFLCLTSHPMEPSVEDGPERRQANIAVIRTTTWVDMKAAFREFGHHAPPFSSVTLTLR